MAIIAVIFDFDDTLVPDSTSKLLREHGIDAEKFWTRDARALVQAGYDPAHAYLKLLLDEVGQGKRLGPLTNRKLREFGATLDADYFSGLPAMFEDLRKIVAEYRDTTIEFSIISGGLQELVSGSGIVQKYFSAVYGCQLAGDSEDSMLKYIRRCVTFTEKTRYLFEINKGLDPKRNSEESSACKSPHSAREA